MNSINLGLLLILSVNFHQLALLARRRNVRFGASVGNEGVILCNELISNYRQRTEAEGGFFKSVEIGLGGS
jgi:hypothetical protein